MNSELIEKFKSVNILVIGDIILDRFISGDTSRVSPEAPVPVVDVTDEKLCLGGAANVLQNICSLGAKGYLCGCVGYDENGERVNELISSISSSINGIIKITDRPTTVKARVLGHGQQIVRYDIEKTSYLSTYHIGYFIDCIHKYLQYQNINIIIISDYAKGVINPELIQRLNSLLVNFKNISVIVDPKINNVGHLGMLSNVKYKVMTPNLHEAENLTGISLSCMGKVSSSQMIDVLAKTINKLKTLFHYDNVLLTMGERGITYLDHDGYLKVIPAVSREVFDVVGAGDTVVAALAVGLASGLSFVDAARLANIAAGIVIGKVGTATVTIDELIEKINAENN